jgi:hypothetical protein
MTVAELIALLQQVPQNAVVIIRDADTGWAMPVHSEFDDKRNRVELYGEYSEADTADCEPK